MILKSELPVCANEGYPSPRKYMQGWKGLTEFCDEVEWLKVFENYKSAKFGNELWIYGVARLVYTNRQKFS